MEPWDGPAALAMTDGRWVLGGMDRNGLRPMRYAITADGLHRRRLRDRHGAPQRGRDHREGPRRPGPDDRRRSRRRASSTTTARSRICWRRAGRSANWVKNITAIDSLIRQSSEPVAFGRDELRRRQLAFGWTLEDLELILQPMVEDAKEAVGSMGDDTPLAVLSDHYRGLHHFFRQNFSQVTNPPIDSLREKRVMTPAAPGSAISATSSTRMTSQCNLLQLNSPVLSNAEFAAMRDYMGDTAVEIDCTFDAGSGGDERRCATAIRRIQREAEDAVRGGCTHVILSDKRVGADRAPIPMILATGAVHSHLVRQQLRTFTSLNVRSGECLDVHYFAVLIGVGATTVNAYLGAGDDRRPPPPRPLPRHDARGPASRATRRRSTRACSRSCRRWASR